MKKFLDEIIECKSAEDYIRLLKLYPDKNIGYSLEESRAFISKTDLRKEIRSFCKTNGISIRLFAKAIGYTDDVGYQNFTKYLKGARPLPYEKVEEAISLIGVL